jgi:excisionase family DNA binding protein
MKTPSPTSEIRLLRLAEAAAYLGVSISSLYGLLQRGALRPLTLPGLRGPRFDRAELEALVERARNQRRPDA